MVRNYFGRERKEKDGKINVLIENIAFADGLAHLLHRLLINSVRYALHFTTIDKEIDYFFIKCDPLSRLEFVCNYPEDVAMNNHFV